MNRIGPRALSIAAVMVLVVACATNAVAAGKGGGARMLVRLPAFSMAPNDGITGIRIVVRGGSVVSVFRPRTWDCEADGFRRGGDEMYCSCPNREYAIFNPAMLPEITVSDESGNEPSKFGIEVVLEIVSASGSRSTKTITQSEMRISR
jgi:hypothetical protein